MKEPAIIEKDQQITVNFVNNNYVKLAFTNLTDFKIFKNFLDNIKLGKILVFYMHQTDNINNDFFNFIFKILMEELKENILKTLIKKAKLKEINKDTIIF